MESATLELRPGTRLDLELGVVQSGASRVRLTPTEGQLLAYLAARPGRDVPTDELHREVWQFAPRVVSRAAFHTVQRLRRKLERDPTNPEHLVTVHGVGYRLVLPGGGQGADPLLVGRQRELDELLATIESSPVLTLTGPPGIGKTRLASAVLGVLRGVFVDLTATPAGGVLQATAQALNLPQDRCDSALGREPQAQVGRALAALGSCVVVLDGAERLEREVTEAIADWRAAAPATRWLITSRVRMGDAEMALGALGVPRPDAPDDEIAESAAVQLWCARIGGELANPAAVREIVRRLEGNPLAIELAAGRVPLLGVDGVLARLDEPLALLRRPDDAQEEGALATTLRWSWALLSEVQRSVLAQVAVFRGPFRMAAAEAIVALAPGSPQVVDVLQQLVDANLVRVLSGTPHRLVLLHIIASFACAQGTDPSVMLRHAQFFARWGASVAPSDWNTRNDELPDLLAAADTALAQRDAALALPLVAAITAVRGQVGPLLASATLVDQALSLEAPPQARHALMLEWANLLGRANQWARALEVVEAVRQDGATGDGRKGGLDTDLVSAFISFAKGDLPTAERSCRQALDRALTDGDAVRICEASTLSASISAYQGRHEVAVALLLRALDRADCAAQRFPIYRALGVAHRLVGDVEKSGAYYELALGASEGNRMAEADVLEALGVLLGQMGELDAASVKFAQATVVWKRLGRDSPKLLFNQAVLAMDRGDTARASVLAHECHCIAGPSGASAMVKGSTRVLLAYLALIEGKPSDSAAALYNEGRELLAGVPVLWALATAGLAEAIAPSDEAATLLEQSHKVLVDSQDPSHLLRWWCHKGQVALRQGDRAAGREAHRLAARLAPRTPAVLAKQELARLERELG